MITTAVSFTVVLGILITVHELGHFLVAKALGIGVEKFSIGFPPRMWGFTVGETEYCLSWIPLGGYVKLKGEGPDEVVDDPGDPALFSARPPWQRAAVIIAGPVMNLIFAFAVMPVHFMVGTEVPSFYSEPPVAGWIEPGSLAEEAGIMPGDRILAINGETVATWEDLQDKLSFATENTLALEVVGSKGSRTLELDLELVAKKGMGIDPYLQPVIGGVNKGSPAQKAGIVAGDKIISLGNIPISSFSQMARILGASAGKTLTVIVERDGEELTLSVTPVLDEKENRGLIGIISDLRMDMRRFPLSEAVVKGFKRNAELLRMTFSFLGDLVTGQTSIKNLGGPVMIFQASGHAAKAGLAKFLFFLAFLSLQLGVLNLFPIPILDGGHLVFLTAEGILKRPLEMRTREMAMKVGFVLLVSLILVITYNDILRLLGIG